MSSRSPSSPGSWPRSVHARLGKVDPGTTAAADAAARRPGAPRRRRPHARRADRPQRHADGRARRRRSAARCARPGRSPDGSRDPERAAARPRRRRSGRAARLHPTLRRARRHRRPVRVGDRVARRPLGLAWRCDVPPAEALATVSQAAARSSTERQTLATAVTTPAVVAGSRRRASARAPRSPSGSWARSSERCPTNPGRGRRAVALARRARRRPGRLRGRRHRTPMHDDSHFGSSDTVTTRPAASPLPQR